MEILTNLGSKGDQIHNNIMYQPIEAQIFDFLKLHLNEQVFYKVYYKTKFFYCEKFQIIMEDKKSNVRLEFKFLIDGWILFRFHEVVHYNKKIYDKMKFFCDKINEIVPLCEKYASLIDKFKSITNKEKLDLVLNKLNEKIKIDNFICYNYQFGYLHQYEKALFGFFIKPIDKAPADGLYFVLEENGKISIKDKTEKLERLLI